MQSNGNNLENDWAEQALSHLYSEKLPDGFETAWRTAIKREESIQMTKQPILRVRFWRIAAPVLTALVLVFGSLWAGTQPFELSPITVTNEKVADGGGAMRSRSIPQDAGKSSLDGTPEAISYSMDSATGNAMAQGAASSNGIKENVSGQKLVRTASTTLHTTAFDTDVERVKALLGELGGYVENLYSYGDAKNGDTRTMRFAMRVPAEQLDRFLSGISGIGRTTDYSESTEDMSVEYADNESRLATQNAKMVRLNELLKQADTVSDLIEIESAIAEAQYQIDAYETSQRGIDRKVNMSAVTINVMEETAAQSAIAADRSLATRIPAALKASVHWIGEFLRNMLVFVIMTLPVLVPVVVLALLAWWCVTLRKRKNNTKNPKTSKED